METNETKSYKAVVMSKPSKEMDKSNGAKYVLITCEILEGPAKGAKVAATRTILNGAGKDKDIPLEGEEVTLYHTYMESTTNEGEYVHFFEISTGIPQTDNNELSRLFGIGTTTKQSI